MSDIDALALRARVRSATGEETQSALQRRGADAARRQVLRRLDAELAKLPASQRSPVACQAGCAFCCHLRVMVTASEVFGLLAYLRDTLDAESWQAFDQRLHAAASEVHSWSPQQRLTQNLPCPVLINGRCSGYAARPLNCRSYHSLDREACEASFNDPGNLALGHPQYSAVARVHEGVQGGFRDGLAQLGQDASQVELVTALCEALDDPHCRERFESGQTAFQRALRID